MKMQGTLLVWLRHEVRRPIKLEQGWGKRIGRHVLLKVKCEITDIIQVYVD